MTTAALSDASRTRSRRLSAPPRPSRTVSTLATGVLALLALAACGQDEPADPTVSTSPAPSASVSGGPTTPDATTTTTGSASPSPPVELPAGFSADEQRSNSWPRLGPRVGTGVEVRVGRHETYDRVVYEFSGLGRPTYRVLWVDEPIDQGAGEVVEVAGDSYLSVTTTTVEIPGEEDPAPREPSASSLDGTVIASAAPIWGGYEGYGEQFIGVRGEPRPFRVSVLEEPTRLVVDIAR